MNSPLGSTIAQAVLEAETCLVSLSHLLTRGLVQEVVVNEGLKGVEVVVARVPDPLTSIKDGTKVNGAQVISQAVKSQEISTREGKRERERVLSSVKSRYDRRA